MNYCYLAFASLAIMLGWPQESWASNAEGEPDVLTTSVSASSEGKALEETKRPNFKLALAACPLRDLPGAYWIQIGNESRNTINLKLVCRFFNALTFNTVRDLTLPRNFPDAPEAAAVRYLQALETRGDDVQVLNLYQLQPDKDLALFGNFKNVEALKAIIDAMNKGRTRNIKRFVLRKGLGFAILLGPIGQLLYVGQLCKQNEITFEYLDYENGCDQIFSRVALDDRQIRLLIKLFTTSFLNGERRFTVARYLKPDADNHLPMDHRLLAMLDLYDQITATKNGNALIERMTFKAYLRHNLMFISNRPDLMSMISYICRSNLCHGESLFNSPYSCAGWAETFDLICHNNTMEMLALLRVFIPDFDEATDFRDGVLRVAALEASVVTCGFNFSHLSRIQLFKCFVSALGHFDKSQQYLLLKRLLPIISLRQLGDVLLEVDSTSRCTNALRCGLLAVNQPAFLSLTDVEYAAFAVYLQETYKYLRPLSGDVSMEAKLMTIFERYQRQKGGLAANK